MKFLSQAFLVCGLALAMSNSLDFILAYGLASERATHGGFQYMMDEMQAQFYGPANANPYSMIELVIFGPQEPTDYELDFAKLSQMSPKQLERAIESVGMDTKLEVNELGSVRPVYYAILGPDTSDFRDLRKAEIAIATIPVVNNTPVDRPQEV